MAYWDFKDLTRETASHKVLGDIAFNIDKNLKYDGYQRGIASMVYKFLDKTVRCYRANTSAGHSTYTGTGINSKNQQLVEEINKTIVRIFEEGKQYSLFKENLSSAEDLVDMQLVSKYNKEIRLLL